MRKQSIASPMLAAIFLTAFVAAHLSSTPCLGADTASPEPTISLSVQNEPLQSVLGRISKTTGWKIKAPEKWMDKRVTQTLNEVTLEKGLRYILKDAGIENLLVTYDESMKVVTVFDTETTRSQSADRPDARMNVRPAVPAIARPPVASPPTGDPVVSRPQTEAGSTPRRRIRGGQRRAPSPEDD